MEDVTPDKWIELQEDPIRVANRKELVKDIEIVQDTAGKTVANAFKYSTIALLTGGAVFFIVMSNKQ